MFSTEPGLQANSYFFPQQDFSSLLKNTSANLMFNIKLHEHAFVISSLISE